MSSRLIIMLVIVLVALVVLMVGGVGGCETVIPELDLRQSEWGGNFRGNVFRVLTDGVITEVAVDTEVGVQRVIVQRASNTTLDWSLPLSEMLSGMSWTGEYDSDEVVDIHGRVHGVRIPVTSGDIILVGVYAAQFAEYSYSGGDVTEHVEALRCVQWMSGVVDGNNRNAPRFSVPATPRFLKDKVHAPSIVLSLMESGSNGTRVQCSRGTNGVVCSGYPCGSDGCQCPPRSGAGKFMDSSCSPVLWAPPSQCEPYTVVPTRELRAYESNSIGSRYAPSRCTWTMSPPSGHDAISLTFLRFATEPGFDFLTVYRGGHNSHPSSYTLWGSFSGSLPVGSNFEITICSNVMLVFRPDAVFSNSGFYFGVSSTSNTSAPCVESGPRNMMQAIASTSSAGMSAPMRPDDENATKRVIVNYVLPVFGFVLILIGLWIFRDHRRRAVTQSVDYDPEQGDGSGGCDEYHDEYDSSSGGYDYSGYSSSDSSSYDHDGEEDGEDGEDGEEDGEEEGEREKPPEYGKVTASFVRDRFLALVGDDPDP